MPGTDSDVVGAAWLVQSRGIAMPCGLMVISRIGGRRSSTLIEDQRIETWPESMRPADDPAAHLQFHLRHEMPDLVFLSYLFRQAGKALVQAWVKAEPTGQYARRAAFLYEWLTDELLEVPANLGGNYVDALDARKLITASEGRQLRVPRWRVNDNLPGTRYFCPIIPRSDTLMQAAGLDVAALYARLSAEYGEDMLMRAAAWLTLRESRASFAIEGEADKAGRIQRFADVMARRTGKGESPLKDATLTTLQQEILGKRTSLTHFGPRQSPVFVGQTVRYQQIVHYVAPPAEDVVPMLDGLQTFLERTVGQSSVMRAAVVAFGFVYIHPLADGNGRVHRFLFNDQLRRDGQIPDGVILPLSALMTDDSDERRAYDKILDRVSAPLMEAVREHIRFNARPVQHPDGVMSNFEFDGDDEVRPMWRYPDLSVHVEYLSRLVRRCLTEHMWAESEYLRRHELARAALKEVIEMPDHQADRVLRSLAQNHGELSNALARELPVLKEEGVWEEIVAATRKLLSPE